MTIKVTNLMPMVFISAAVKEYTSQSGSKGLSYSLSLETPDGEVGSLPCTKDVYEFSKTVEKYKKVRMYADYNTNYKNLRVTDFKVAE